MELELAQEIARRELSMAINVQKKFLPDSAPKSDAWDIACIFKPFAGVS